MGSPLHAFLGALTGGSLFVIRFQVIRMEESGVSGIGIGTPLGEISAVRGVPLRDESISESNVRIRAAGVNSRPT